jgi:acyl-coenzyme A synthetase/AMP-(fatty) acid ligase
MITPEGTIACQGDTLMSGYLGDPELTASVLRDETVYMADMGHIDEEGRLHIDGRADDGINVGGYKVAPTEVEDQAMTFTAVRDCICTAVPHPITGQALKLLVVMAEGQRLEKRLLALHLKETCPGHYREIPYGTGHVDFEAAVKTAWELGVRRYVTEFWYKDGGETPKEVCARFTELLDRQT